MEASLDYTEKPRLIGARKKDGSVVKNCGFAY